MELHRAAKLNLDCVDRSVERSSEQDGAAPECCEGYAVRLALSAERRRELLRATAAGGAATDQAMLRLHRALAGPDATPADSPYVSVECRLQLAYGAPRSDTGPLFTKDERRRVRLLPTPPIRRSTMVPQHWPPRFGFRFAHAGRTLHDAPPAGAAVRDWHGAAAWRRLLLVVLTLAQTALGTYWTIAVLPYHGSQPLELAILCLFAILFFWISAGFWTAVMGLRVLLARKDPYAITGAIEGSAVSAGLIDPAARVALVMPICNEDVVRVFAGLRATYESLARTGALDHFDLFVLSDSNDPDIRAVETQAWLGLCRELRAFGRLFYRWRKYRVKRKSGNIGDFCRRWGKTYRYMVVLDADSVMSGECLVKLLRMMEARPDAGIIQTAPHAAGRETLYSRIQQFAASVYGPLFTAGLHYWQLGESHYWGHNAIIRVAPFIRHCALGRLPGDGALSGEILSHDFVEAALMRRAGWTVWIAYDLPGSYEEMPPNLIDELKRDQRWCKGNLINLRLFFAQGVHAVHRAVFMTGVMAYASAPLWFIYLLLSTGLLAVYTLVPPAYFAGPHQLFPIWPEWHLHWAIGLFSATAALLLLPRLFSLVAIVVRQRVRHFGGAPRLVASMLLELLLSMLLAPIRMLFHTRFVLSSLLGRTLQWKSPPREDAETTWGEALRRHGLHTVFGLLWAGGVYLLNPSYLWWLLPVVGALMLSIPLSVYSSRVSLGRLARKARLFLIPEEARPPGELRATRRLVRRRNRSRGGFVEAIVDPLANALACACGVDRNGATLRIEQAHLVQRALTGGPDVLDARQKMALLNDPVALSQLHLRVWTASQPHPLWVAAREAPQSS